ncbi:hypothetical protein D9758_005424 [Tetrapyrgos nigripes]|uniref:Alpha/beta hydrolase fold-3 domain-containing protein n=1 Tax=Tetrapyrgos nigripes TaxID=182062 RepID=A0A8H5LQ08_9AGAR|nr:hypothetical protein D9758_005424 [Tetrapyrgos nigripes]
MAEYAHLSTPDPDLVQALKAMSQMPRMTDFVTGRAAMKTGLLSHVQRKLKPQLPPDSEYEVQDYMIDTGDGSGAQVLARSVVPRKNTPDEKFPLLFWIHGGSWSMGSADMDDYQMRITSVKLRIAVVNCEYRLAPEHPFPIGLNDCHAVLKHVASNPEKFSAELSKGFIIAGSSAGGNLSAVLSHRVRDDTFFKERGVSLTGQALLVPIVIHREAYPELPEDYRSRLLSLGSITNAPGLTREDGDLAFASYKAPPTDPNMSPLLFPSHKGLPPAFIQVCGLDPVRDDGLLYERVLKADGVETKLIVYPGAPHWVEYWFPHKQVGKKFRQDFVDGIKWLLDFSSKDSTV